MRRLNPEAASAASRAPRRVERIEPLAALPLFFNLRCQHVVVAGDDDGAVWKAELLAAAGASVAVFAPEPPSALLALAEAPPAGAIRLHARAWRPLDLLGARLAVGALEGAEAEAFAAAARRAGAVVNIVDRPALSDASFATIVNRAPVTIAIGTDGAAPVLGQALRARIEALLHPALGAWADAARAFRARAKARTEMGPARRALWRRFADAALEAVAPPSDGALAAIFDAAPTAPAAHERFEIDPNRPEDLTLGALRALQQADVILYDDGAPDAILRLGRREARRIQRTGPSDLARLSQERVVELVLA